MNSVANGKVYRNTPFKKLHIQSAASDAGGAIGAAFVVWNELNPSVFQIREERRGEIPAVTHADGSGRLQTVYRKTNPRYYRLIESFRDITGVPVVLNTSFNENEPVVCKPEEALACFLRTKMDLLVMGEWFIVRDA